MTNTDQDISSLIQSFELLRDEHLLVLSISQHEVEFMNNYEADLIKKDFALIQHSTDKLNLAIEDAQVLKLLSQYLREIDAERKAQFIKILKINEESDWLKDEVALLQSNLRKSEERIIELEEENKHLKFLFELKSIDNNIDNIQEKAKESPDYTKTDQNSLPENGDFRFNDGEYENRGNSVNTQSGTGFELPPRLKTLHNLVIQYAAQGRYEVAIPLCKQTLEDLEKTSGRNHPDVATMLNILALVYRDQNKYTDALSLLKEALVIRENTLGPVHVAVAANLNNLAVLYGKQKKFNEAEPLCKRSLIIREQLLGPDHPDVAKQLNNLALLCQNQNKYAEVESYYLRAIQIYTKAFGKDKDDVVKTKLNLASVYMKQAKFKDAELVYKEILNVVHESLCGEIAANNKPIWMLAEEKQYGSVGDNFNTQKDEKDSWEKIREKNWYSVFTAMKNLACLYRQQNKTEAADILDNFVNENMQQANEKQSVDIGRSHYTSEKIPIPRMPSGMGQRSSSGYITSDCWTIQRTNQMKSNLNVRPNNLNRNAGPVKPSRSSLVDSFTSKISNSPTVRESRSPNMRESKTPSTDFYNGNGNGRMKKASSMCLLPGAPQKSINIPNPGYNNPQMIKMNQMSSGQTWLSQGRTASIENIKKAFGKRS